MSTLEESVRRLPLELRPNPRRVLLRPFMPALVVKPLAQPEPNARVTAIFSRVMMLSEEQVEAKLEEVLREFDDRHGRIAGIFEERFEQIRPMLPTDRNFTAARRQLLGSYFINEYSLESSALFNPSMVPAPDQSGCREGELRFVLSLRATGEGHVSSITFRSGVLGPEGEVRLDGVSRFVRQPRPQPAARYELGLFRRKLEEMGVEAEAARAATEGLPERFSFEELVAVAWHLRSSGADAVVRQAVRRALALAEANYTVCFEPGLDMSEKILFPFSPGEANGIEDARFVRFVEEDGSVMYYATYTAYDGNAVLPQMVATADFQEFSMCTLNGPAVRNKGLALFPRRVNGLYAMLGRQDSENIHIMFSENLHFWHESRIILRPCEPWEFIQLGNCGSPIELPEGWLVLTHGVGPMRKYCIGAALLDLKDPCRVLGRLREPLLKPAADEREGYVPNVVYSCGGLVHRGLLILPYAVSDTATRFATVPVSEILRHMSPPE